MYQIKCSIDDETAVALEEFFCELTGCSPWVIFRKDKHHPYELFGYFTDPDEQKTAWQELRTHYPSLPEDIPSDELDDRDWKEEYKKFLKPWTSHKLHWVPEWMKEQYEVPSGDEVVYFDAGMAFGTGNHETTQLCAVRMLERKDELGADFENIEFIDAGCGSGILSISAAKLACKNIYGFDRDPEAIRVSDENITRNNLPADSINYEECGIEDGLEGKKADLILANIQADVLCIYAEIFLNAIKPGGLLVLSGILAREIDEVREKFDPIAKSISGGMHSSDSRVKGEWCDLVYDFKNS